MGPRRLDPRQAYKPLDVGNGIVSGYLTRGGLQVIRLSAPAATRFVATWTGAMHLRRAAYTQLTPGGSLPQIAERTTTGRDERGMWLADEELELALGIVTPAPLTLAAGA